MKAHHTQAKAKDTSMTTLVNFRQKLPIEP